MNQKKTPYERLFTPLKIKGVTLRNRIVMPPMNTNLAEADGSVSDRLLRYYVERGKGGAGLIIIAAAVIDLGAKRRKGSLGLYDDSLIPKFRKMTAAIHETGAKVLQQLNHNGRLLTSTPELKATVTSGPIGPSAVPHLLTGVIPKVLTVEEIGEWVEKFAQAARRAKEAGYDGVEIHGTHGYLINQFFSRYSNRRTDRYGGSLDNRMRFALEVYRRVRELTGNDFLICFRFNAREFAPIETPIEDVIALCRALSDEGVDLLHMSVGNGETPSNVIRFAPPGGTSLACYTDYSLKIKQSVNVPVIAVGRINMPEVAEEVLRQGKADLVSVGRGLIADPYWPDKALKGETAKIRRCIACNQGCIEELVQEREVACLYNPEVGREEERQTATKRKKVWVVGGGPAGMEAAAVAASRGHHVDLFEQEGELGGQDLLAAVPPTKEEFLYIRDYLRDELERQSVPIHLNEEITAEKVLKGKPDVVILATGSLPLIPDIPGVKLTHVLTAWDVLKGKKTGEKVIVAGAGLVGVETALFLFQKGKRVILIEMLEAVGKDSGPLNRARMREALEKTDIEVKCKTELLKIDEKGVRVRGEGGEYDIPGETVVLALGARSQNALFQKLEGKIPEVYSIGDCVKPRKILEAVQEAYQIASKI